MPDHLIVLQERLNWLNARIDAKRRVGWETQWDERERDALRWAIVNLNTIQQMLNR